MKSLRNKLVFSIALVIVFKCLLWLSLIPIWHTPDEQSHFAQLSYIAEKRTLSVDHTRNLSLEIAKSEKYLGVYRDEAGNNLFTYHPQYNLSYTNSNNGLFESTMASESLNDRLVMVRSEASGYPPLYYLLSLPAYFSSYSNSIIDRVFSVRTINIILQLGLFAVAYKIGREIWSEGKWEPISLGLLVVFQPMISFVAAGVHPDNLLNILTSLGVLVSIRLLKYGFKWRYLLELLIIILLGCETKVFMLFCIPAYVSVLGMAFLKNGKLKYLGLILPIVIAVLVFILQIPLPYLPVVTSPKISLFEYLQFRLPKMAYEVWPWYWGVYRWLSLSLPINILRVITRVVVLLIIGIFIRTFIIIKSKFQIFELKTVVLMVFLSASYILFFLLFDFKTMQMNGFSVGVQGRYFLPNISAHMILLLFGWKGILNLINSRINKKVSDLLILVLPLAMIILNIISLYVVSVSYYDSSSLSSFLTQYSQYKPIIIKSNYLVVILVMFGSGLVLTSWYTFKYNFLTKEKT